MIPFLFPASTAAEPTTGDIGCGVLSDTISCYVEREINGMYELTMQYPITGPLYGEIALRSLLFVAPNDTEDKQFFRIYKISKPMRGVVTINARHIAYDLAGYICPPISANTISAAFSAIEANAVPNNDFPFDFSTSRTTSATFTVSYPCDVWSLMSGQQGSLLDVYTGEWDFDNWTIKLPTRLGSDNGARIVYGENMKDVRQDENCASMYTGIYPYWYTDEDGLVTLTEEIVSGPGTYSFEIIKAVDFTDRIDTKPSEAQLRAAAQAYVAANDVGVPQVSIDVDFVPLWQTEEYKNNSFAANLERIGLGDTVKVSFPALGVNATARAVAYRYNCLKDRYDKITIGSAQADMGQVIQQMIDNSI